MTAQEKSMIDDLVNRIRDTPVAEKDVDAERYLQQTLGVVPDALYILTQTVLVQQYGLTQAQAQLAAKQQEIDELQREQNAGTQAPPKSSGSFLSRIFGSDEPSQAGTPARVQGAAATQGGYQPVNYPPPAQGGYPPPPSGAGQVYGSGPGYGPAYGGPGYGGSSYGSAPGGMGGFGGGGFGGGGGFLRGALQTAAGVAAGEMVFRGMEDLFQGFGGGGSHGLAGSPGETVVNNYYDDGGREHGNPGSSGGDDSAFYNPSHDASRENLGAGDSETDSGSRGFGAFGDGGSDAGDASLDDSNTFGDDSSDSGDSFGDDGGFGDSGDDSNS